MINRAALNIDEYSSNDDVWQAVGYPSRVLLVYDKIENNERNEPNRHFY